MTTENAPLRTAIVGTGAIAHAHAEAVKAYPHAEVVAVTDLDATRARDFAAQFGIAGVHDSLERMLELSRPDVVHICTPPGVHHDQAIAALESGSHVVVEKPPASSLEELDEMRAAAGRAGRELAVVFQQRTGTAAAHARELLTSGALGRPLIAQCQTLWFRDPAYFAVPWRGRWETEGGGPTLGHAIHQIDLLAYLLGDWATVQGRLWRLDRETQTEDASTATVTFANGTVAEVVTSAVSPREVSAIRIDTQKATMTVEHLYGHGHEHWKITPAPHIDPAETESWSLPPFEERSGHEFYVRDVYDALRSGAPLPSVASDPARSSEIVAAIYASAAGEGALITPDDLAAHATHRRSFSSPVTDQRDIGA